MNAMQITLLIASTLMLIYVIYSVRKNKMNVHYSTFWILWGVSLIILSIFPVILDVASKFLSIATPTSTLFLVMIFILYCLTFNLCMRLSKNTDEIVKLNYELSVLNKKLSELENKKKPNK